MDLEHDNINMDSVTQLGYLDYFFYDIHRSS